MSETPRCAVVAIGRNEGQRLIRCFDSIDAEFPVVYVDSGSTDGSVEEAIRRGLKVVTLSTDVPFTAARARNAGWRALLEAYPDLEYIQFVDGDCEFAPGWVEIGLEGLKSEPDLCAIFGRRRERFPEASIYNALCDEEWNKPLGLIQACGGDVLFRVSALQEAGGYSDDLIAGEEPDLCLRLGRKGWKVRCVDEEMTLHDAHMMHARQQWLRMRRSGHAYAEHCARHGAHAFVSWRKERNRILLWGLVLPLLVGLLLVMALIFSSFGLALAACAVAALYPLQILRLVRRELEIGHGMRFALAHSFWLVAGKVAMAGGMLQFWRNRLHRRHNSLIEYKAG